MWPVFFKRLALSLQVAYVGSLIKALKPQFLRLYTVALDKSIDKHGKVGRMAEQILQNEFIEKHRFQLLSKIHDEEDHTSSDMLSVDLSVLINRLIVA